MLQKKAMHCTGPVSKNVASCGGRDFRRCRRGCCLGLLCCSCLRLRDGWRLRRFVRRAVEVDSPDAVLVGDWVGTIE